MQSNPTQTRRVGGKGIAVACWLVILGLIALVLIGHAMTDDAETEGEASTEEQDEPIIDLLFLINGRISVGLDQLGLSGAAPGLGEPSQLSAPQLLQAAPIEAELRGFDAALELLDEFDARVAQSKQDTLSGSIADEDEFTAEILVGIYSAPPSTRVPLSDADIQTLHDRLGWFGELALVHANAASEKIERAVYSAAKRTVFALVALVCWILGCGLVGCVTAILMLTLAWGRRVSFGLAPERATGSVYLEAFTLWMVFHFVALTAISAWVSAEYTMPASFGVFAVGLLVVLWPVVRGVSWRDVRSDIGVSPVGKWPGDIGCGFLSYSMALPLMIVGALMVYVGQIAWDWFVSRNAGGRGAGAGDEAPAPAAHPIIEQFAHMDASSKLFVVMLAVVAAPIVEELVFRGLLYRHLRSTLGRSGGLFAIIACMLINAFIFSIIHPQGLLGVPQLMAAAIGMLVAREWRNSLPACITAHAMVNGVSMAVMLLLFA